MTFRIVRRSRVFSIFRWTRTGPGPTRNVSATASPCQPASGTARPPMRERISAASRDESGIIGIFGRLSASAMGIRLASGVDAQPGVSGSPGTRKS